MYIWQDSCRSPFLNMAIDEWLLQKIMAYASPLLRVYSWDRLAVSIGYFQEYPKNMYPKRTIVRRITGGGTVFHGSDFTFSLVVSRKHRFYQLKRLEIYYHINQIIVKALRSIGCSAQLADNVLLNTIDPKHVHCFQQPVKYDVLFNNNKIAGGAQRRNSKGILYQGSIKKELIPSFSLMTFSHALTEMLTKSFNSRKRYFSPSKDLYQGAEYLACKKYAHKKWNQKR